MRAPSSFHSTRGRAEPGDASPMLSAVCASIGWSGRKSSRPELARGPARLPRSRPRDRARGRRAASAPGAPSARGTRAPSPPRRPSRPRARPAAARRRSRPARKRCSVSVARANSSRSSRRRSVCDPGPVAPPICCRAASTSRSSSVAAGAGAGKVTERGPADADRRVRQLSGQIGHRHRHLLGAQRGQTRGDRLGLPEPRRGLGDGSRRARDLFEQHSAILASDGLCAARRPEPARPPRPRSRAAAGRRASPFSARPRSGSESRSRAAARRRA